MREATTPSESTADTSHAGGLGEPGRLRSAGVLTTEELAYCRSHSIPVSYDPVQIGWVPSNVIDDVSGEDDDLAHEARAMKAAAPSVRPATVSSPATRIEQRFIRWARGEIDKGSSDATGADRLWAQPESVVAQTGSDLGAEAQLNLLRSLQEKANELIHQHYETREQTARRLEQALAHEPAFVLRAWSEQDLDRYVHLLDNPEVWKYLPEEYPSPLTRENAQILIDISNSLAQHQVFAIEQAGEIVGQVRMLFSADGGTDCEISYWLGQAYWGKGIISKIIPLYTARTFKEFPDIKSIFAKVAVGNDGSARALLKAGYRDEGTLASRLAGDEATRILRCFRADYM